VLTDSVEEGAHVKYAIVCCASVGLLESCKVPCQLLTNAEIGFVLLVSDVSIRIDFGVVGTLSLLKWHSPWIEAVSNRFVSPSCSHIHI